MELTLVSIILLSVIVGYIIGMFFSKKEENVMQITMSSASLIDAIKSLHEDGEILYQEDIKLKNQSINEDSLADDLIEDTTDDTTAEYTEENTEGEERDSIYTEEGKRFYEVNLPVITVSDSPENAYFTVLKSIKRLKENKFFKNGFINDKKAFVKNITDRELEKIITGDLGDEE